MFRFGRPDIHTVGGRILMYLMIWAAIFIGLTVIALVKYRSALCDVFTATITDLAVAVIILIGIAIALKSVFR